MTWQRKERITPDTWVCIYCGIEKPISEFYKLARLHTGHYYHCKECHKERQNTKYTKEESYRIRQKKLVKERKKIVYHCNEQYRLGTVVRIAIYKIIKNSHPSVTDTNCKKLCSCTRDKLIKHIESTWEPGMTWDNYGKEWCLDHIKPLISFNLLLAKQRKLSCHYSNIQALWKRENLRKGCKLPP